MEQTLDLINRWAGLTTYPALAGISVCYALLLIANRPPRLRRLEALTVAIFSAAAFAWLALVAADRVPLPTLYSQLLARGIWLVVLVVLAGGVVRTLRQAAQHRTPAQRQCEDAA